jgi:hypothetical protein
MKKSFLAIIGSISILSNFIFADFAFGTTINAVMDPVCIPISMEFYDESYNHQNFKFDDILVSPSAQAVFGDKIGPSYGTTYQNGTAQLPIYGKMYIYDKRYQGCDAGLEGFLLTATATDLCNNWSGETCVGDSIPAAGNFYVVTTTNFNWSPYSWNLYNDGDTAFFYYGVSFYPAPSDVITYINADSTDPSLTDLTDTATFTGITYDNNIRSTPIDIMYRPSTADWWSGWYHISFGYYLNVPGNTPPGTYTTTINYTISAAS